MVGLGLGSFRPVVWFLGYWVGYWVIGLVGGLYHLIPYIPLRGL